MLSEATAASISTVIACDCNSDPLYSAVKADVGDTVPHKAPYELITETYTDQWLAWAPAEEGWTSGLDELAMRSPRPGPTGTELTDRDPATGLWPSDHAGVVLRLRGL